MRLFYGPAAAFFCAAALLVVSPGRAEAQPVNTTLDTFLPGGANAGGVNVGDKRFSGFTFSSTGDGPIQASAVDVSISGDDTSHQLRFSFVRDVLDATAGQTTDVVICYRVDVLGNQLINGVGLAFNPNITGGTGGNAAASVIETVQTTNGSPLLPGGTEDDAVLSVFFDGPGGGDNTTASLVVNPTQSLLFCKDILVSSRDGGGRVVISTVDNFVTQVPEPGVLGMLAAGGLLLSRRRR